MPYINCATEQKQWCFNMTLVYFFMLPNFSFRIVSPHNTCFLDVLRHGPENHATGGHPVTGPNSPRFWKDWQLEHKLSDLIINTSAILEKFLK